MFGDDVVKLLVDILVEIIEVPLLVRLSCLVLEKDTGVGVAGIGVGIRRGSGCGFVLANLRVGLDLMDDVVADVLFELLRELPGDVDHGFLDNLRRRGRGLLGNRGGRGRRLCAVDGRLAGECTIITSSQNIGSQRHFLAVSIQQPTIPRCVRTLPHTS